MHNIGARAFLFGGDRDPETVVHAVAHA